MVSTSARSSRSSRTAPPSGGRKKQPPAKPPTADLQAEPLSTIEWLPASDLHANTWNPNRVNKPELRLLERSLLLTGWIQPILALPDRTVVDGFHRWRLSQDSKAVRERWGGLVPVATVNLTLPEAMLMTIRVNRAKGFHQAAEMARIVRELVDEHGWELQDIGREIGADKRETELLAQESVFAAHGIAQHAYSQAWYPQKVDKQVPHEATGRI